MKKGDSETILSGIKKSEKKINLILNRLETFADDVKVQRTSSIKTTKSLKILTDRLNSLPSHKSPSFNKDSPYLLGKEKIIKNNKKYLEKQSIDHLIQVIDNQPKSGREFLTEDLMKTDEAKKALKSKKRGFAFSNKKTPDELNKLKVFVNLIDEKKKKMLSEILYNQKFMKKEADRENFMHSKFQSLRSSSKLSPVSLSPSLSRALSRNLQDLELRADYFKTVLKEDREINLKKCRLSRYLSMKGVFNVAS